MKRSILVMTPFLLLATLVWTAVGIVENSQTSSQVHAATMRTLYVANDKPSVILIPIEVLEVGDGDTIECHINFPWDITMRDQKIRCLGYDAWETTKRRQSVKVTDEEVKKGALAKAALKRLVEEAEAVYISPGKDDRGPYGRILGRLWIYNSKDGMIDIAVWMEANGHTRISNAENDALYK